MIPQTSSADRRRARAGFTLLELLIAVAVMALALALVLPDLRRSLDSNLIQTTHFDFQRQLTGLRSQAYHEGQAILLVGTGEFVDDPEADPRPAEIQFQDTGWSYRVLEPMLISAGGVCAPATVEVFDRARLAMRLVSRPDCRVMRVAL